MPLCFAVFEFTEDFNSLFPSAAQIHVGVTLVISAWFSSSGLDYTFVFMEGEGNNRILLEMLKTLNAEVGLN